MERSAGFYSEDNVTYNPDWSLVEGNDELRATVEMYLPVAQMQSMNGPFGKESPYSVVDFDNAIKAKDSDTLLNILNDAWLRAPESRDVYADPGFRLLCDICDGSQGDFLSDEVNYDEDDDQ